MYLLSLVDWPSDSLLTVVSDLQLSSADLLLVLVLRALLATHFFGGRLEQRDGDDGQLVLFPGMIIFEMAGFVRSRISNPNVAVEYGQPDRFERSIWRFRSGREYQSKRAQIGQLYGHFLRAVDDSSGLSLPWLPMAVDVTENQTVGSSSAGRLKACPRRGGRAPLP